MPSPIIARADALMQRRRQSGVEADEPPVLTDALEDDDIPVLFHVDLPEFTPARPVEDEPLPTLEITLEGLPNPASEFDFDLLETTDTPANAASAPSPSPTNLQASPARLAQEVARRIEQRLLAELPGLISSTLEEIFAESPPFNEAEGHGDQA